MAAFGRLPKRFPVGTRYVVEGEPGKEGQLRVTSRYVVLPNGAHFDLTEETFERPRSRTGRRQSRTSRATRRRTKH